MLCQKDEYKIPINIENWKEICQFDGSSPGSNSNNGPEEVKKEFENPYRNNDEEDTIKLFVEKFDEMERFINGDYEKIKSRENNEGNILSDETLIQRKDIIVNESRIFKSAFKELIFITDQLNHLFCKTKKIVSNL